jgi:hypothetical protein
MLRRLFPVRLDNEGYRGRAAGLWLFALFLVLRAIMRLRGAINIRVAASADGLRLDGLGEGAAQTILFLFQGLSLAHLPLVAIGAAANAVPRTEAGAVGVWINLALLALLFAGLVLSLWTRPSAARPSPAS